METTQSHTNSAQNQPVYDVIISGAGPVGLFLACELALAHCSVLLLEKTEQLHTPLKQLPFGIRGLNALSVEALDRRGMLSGLKLHKRLKQPHMNPTAKPEQPVKAGGHFAGIQFDETRIDLGQWPYRLPSSLPTQLLSELDELETLLTARATALGVELRRGVAVTAFHQTADGVTVQSDDHTFAGKWLVGCDGSRSVVRKLGGFAFTGTEPEFTGYSLRVDLADPEKLKPGRNVTPTGMYLQSQPGYLILQDFDGGAFQRSQQPITREHAQEVLRRISNTDITIQALHIGTAWTDRTRQTTTYRNGRVLLAGDAAHIHSPLGGQGLNLGLGDALNLGWKLAATIQGQAPDGLLDTYDTERHPIGAQVLEWSRAQVALMRPDPAAHALRAIFRDLMGTSDGATYIASRVWGLTTHYDLAGPHPIVGHSAPNFAFEDGTTLNEHLRNGRAVLLDFNTNDSLRKLAGTYGDQLTYLAGHAKEQLGLSTLLIRPDGFVAWAGEGEPDESALRQVIAHGLIAWAEPGCSPEF